MKMKKLTFAGAAAALILVGAITVILVTSAFSANSDTLEGNVSHSGSELPPIPTDLDESIRSVILHEAFDQYGEFVGYERLISVSPSSENNFTAEQWQAILTAIDMGIVLWDETDRPVPVITERGRRLIDLSESSFAGDSRGLDNFEFFTDNSLTITLAETYPVIYFSGVFYLYDTNDESTYVARLAFDNIHSRSTTIFLSSETTYILVARDLDESAVVMVSAEME